MNALLVAAAVIITVTAGIHSILGERYIIRRLLRRPNLPHLFGSDWLTKRTIRFAWHLTSIAWLGLAGVIVVFATPADLDGPALDALAVVRWTFLVSACITFVASRGRHLAWIMFGAVAAALWIGV
jgi:hypothetical protein